MRRPKTKMTPELIEAITQARLSGKTIEEVADEFQLAKMTVVKYTPKGIVTPKRATGLSGPYGAKSSGPGSAVHKVSKPDMRGHRRHRRY